MEVPVAREAAQNMLLEMQAEQVVMATLEELYVKDDKRGVYRWGTDLVIDDVDGFIEGIIAKVVYGK